MAESTGRGARPAPTRRQDATDGCGDEVAHQEELRPVARHHRTAGRSRLPGQQVESSGLIQEIGGDGLYVDLMSFHRENYRRYRYLQDAAEAIAPTARRVHPMLSSLRVWRTFDLTLRRADLA